MEDNYFTMLWRFLPYIDINRPWLHMCSPILNLPSLFPPHRTPLGYPRAPDLVVLLYASNCTDHLFYLWQYTCFNAILSNHPTLAFAHRLQKSILYICFSFAALYIGSSLPSFYIPYICINIQYLCFSFWLLHSV